MPLFMALVSNGLHANIVGEVIAGRATAGQGDRTGRHPFCRRQNTYILDELLKLFTAIFAKQL